VLGLDMAHCSGCTREPFSAFSPDPLPMMAEVCPVRTGQRAFCHGHRGDPLIGYMVPGDSSFQQRSSSWESGRPRTSRGLSTSDSSQGGESGSSGELPEHGLPSRYEVERVLLGYNILRWSSYAEFREAVH